MVDLTYIFGRIEWLAILSPALFAVVYVIVLMVITVSDERKYPHE